MKTFYEWLEQEDLLNNLDESMMSRLRGMGRNLIAAGGMATAAVGGPADIASGLGMNVPAQVKQADDLANYGQYRLGRRRDEKPDSAKPVASRMKKRLRK